MGEKKYLTEDQAGEGVWFSVGKGVEAKFNQNGNRKKDRQYCYRINFSVRGKRYGYYILGWSPHWTAAKAEAKREEYKENAKYGRKPWNPKQESQQIEEKLKRQEEEEQRQARERITFDEVWENYYFKAEDSKKMPKTWDLEHTFYTHYLQPVLGHLPLVEIEKDALKSVKRKMSDKSARSQYYALCIVRQVFHRAIEEGLYMYRTPFERYKNIMPEGADKQRLGTLTQEEEKKLLSALKEKSQLMHDVALMSLYSGMRFGEVARMQWQHIDWENNRITIYNAKDPQNPNKVRHAFFNQTVKNMLLRRFNDNNSALVFPGKNGKAMTTVPKTFARTVEELGLNKNRSEGHKISFYTLRHSFASRLVNMNCHTFVLSELMGHSNPTMTKRYSHNDGQYQQAVGLLDKYFIQTE